MLVIMAAATVNNTVTILSADMEPPSITSCYTVFILLPVCVRRSPLLPDAEVIEYPVEYILGGRLSGYLSKGVNGLP